MEEKTKNNIEIGIAVLEMIIKYGLPAAIKIINTLDKEDITVEDIRALADRVPHPDNYEEEGG